MADLGNIGKQVPVPSEAVIGPRYYLAGTMLLVDTSPTFGRVKVWRFEDNSFVAAAVTDPTTGAWQINNLVEAGPYAVVGQDADHAENAVIFADVAAVSS